VLHDVQWLCVHWSTKQLRAYDWMLSIKDISGKYVQEYTMMLGGTVTCLFPSFFSLVFFSCRLLVKVNVVSFSLVRVVLTVWECLRYWNKDFDFVNTVVLLHLKLDADKCCYVQKKIEIINHVSSMTGGYSEIYVTSVHVSSMTKVSWWFCNLANLSERDLPYATLSITFYAFSDLCIIILAYVYLCSVWPTLKTYECSQT